MAKTTRKKPTKAEQAAAEEEARRAEDIPGEDTLTAEGGVIGKQSELAQKAEDDDSQTTTDPVEPEPVDKRVSAQQDRAGQTESAPETGEDQPDLADLDADATAPDLADTSVASVRGDAIERTHDTLTQKAHKRERGEDQPDIPEDDQSPEAEQARQTKRIMVDVQPPDATGEFSDKRTPDSDPAGIKTGKFSQPAALDPNRVTPHLEGASSEVMHPNPDAPPSVPYGEPQPVEGSSTTVFESREREPAGFDVMGIRPQRRFNDGRLEWHVPEDKAERFENHHHVRFGRIRKKG